MSFSEFFDRMLLFIVAIGISACLVLIPLNYRAKDEQHAKLLNYCISRQPDTYIQCIDHINWRYDDRKANKTNKGY